MIYPNPDMHESWKSWAKALLGVLIRRGQAPVTQVHSYTVASVPTPSQDGLVVQITDEQGGTTLATSYQGQWLRVADGDPIG